MHKLTSSMVATTVGLALLIGSLTSSAAKPRGGAGLLSLCISNYNACMRVCGDSPYLPTNYNYAYCANGCWDNHAACVDAAFGFARASGNTDVLGVQPGPRRK
jgi:hypothetical protein